jgi:hypothetical protein
MHQVLSNIRAVAFLMLFVLSFVGYISSPLAQTEETIKQPKTSDTILQVTPKKQNNSSKQQAILRLEDTIRGNKEQPQVITIVPWQLPVHKRINENSEWQLQVTRLNPIERNAFLRNLAIVNELNAIQVASDHAKLAPTENEPPANK